jgi:glycosyltransferase involved in cell wall biosynthesis
MTLAFYAPMKPPDHPVPSGDRSMARALVAALEFAGADVTIASDLQTRDGRGIPEVQSTLIAASVAEVSRLARAGKMANWKAWVSYHNYYKAPDLLGPSVSKALEIPYIQVESTRARKRLTGPWASFAKAAEDAADAADLIFYFTDRDAFALQRDAPSKQSVVKLHPFIQKQPEPYSYDGRGPILSVGMMREGDKLASYTLIAETLGRMPDTDWDLVIAGDGPARADIEALMAPFGSKVTFLGQCDEGTLHKAYQNAALFFWPGVNEAFGMAYIEAQAAGLPIIAQDRPGVRDVLPVANYPPPDQGVEGLCQTLQHFLNNPKQRELASRASFDNAVRNHMLPAAAETLKTSLSTIGVYL